PFDTSGDIAAAVASAASNAVRSQAAEPVVLLSPAAASFDQFPNFERRGDAFVAAVARLPGIELLADVGDDDAASEARKP
ncbi:MAG: hypothetical protein AAFY64_04740, partial [Pseudomonadota bacterium]